MSTSMGNPILSMINGTMVDLASSSNLSYLWNFGSLLGLTLVIQLMTGIFLAMHYCPDTDMAFASMNHILSDVNYGFLLKYLHANGASMFFMCVYLHMGRGLYHGSYLKKHLWFSGMTMFMVMMITAFMGYVLPWGQMSFWGATVMTNFVSAVPYMGNQMVQWIWGGFGVGNATLNSFFSLHYLFPFMLAGLSIIHLTLLHLSGSNNPIGVGLKNDVITFHPYYTMKDLYGILMLTTLMISLICFVPNVLGDPENYMKANPLVTPVHIMPEWYFLFAYAMLSAMPNKLGGVIALALSMMVLFMLPFVHTSSMKGLGFSPFGKMCYWLFISNFFLLTWMGSKVVEEPFMFMGQMSSIFYFSYFILIMPVMGLIDNSLILKKNG